MTRFSVFQFGVLAMATAVLSIGGAADAQRVARRAPPANWAAQATLTPAGTHLMGNPAAPVKLVEYVSYTCNHCAAYSSISHGALSQQ